MNKFESSLLQTLASIDESLKALAGRKVPTAKAPAKPAAKAAPKTAKKPGNGALPKAAAKAAKVLEKGKGAAEKTKVA